MNRKRLTTIYALCDPVTSEVRYIGKSVNIKNRYKEHCKSNKDTYSSCWIRSLKPLRPLLIELEVVPDGWVEAEQFWIAYFKGLGARLTNLTLGGEGMVGYKATEETCRKMSILSMGNRYGAGNTNRLGYTTPEETKLKISMALKGNIVVSDETRVKMSISAKGHKRGVGRVLSEETKIKISLALVGKKLSSEHKAKLSIASTGNTNALGRKHTDEERTKLSLANKRTQERKAMERPTLASI